MAHDRNAALILGAGFSKAAELPLTWELFSSEVKVRAQCKKAEVNNAAVQKAFENAIKTDPNLPVEVWLAQLYAERENPLQSEIHGTRWMDAIRFILARLVNLPNGSNTHYYYGVGTYGCHPHHLSFWERLEKEFNLKYIVTMNYDILVEQSLHTDKSVHRTMPRWRYGGFQHVQVVRKITDIRGKGKFELMPLGDEFVIYKLHGSVNWAWEPHSPSLKIHHDVRPVYRVQEDLIPAIVPPIPEKDMPPEFGQIWNEAKKVLAQTPNWVICGYSLPDYDEALKNWFGEILEMRKTENTKLIILDPYSNNIAAKWEALSKNCEIIPLKGLPDALEETWV
jgi:SIR2-like domain